jgi:hypothetical protein
MYTKNQEYYENGLKNINSKILLKGKIDGVGIVKLLELCDKYFHIHIEESIYSNGCEDAEWYDIEGIEYGWLWMRCEDAKGNFDKKKNSEILKKKIKQVVKDIWYQKKEGSYDDVYYAYTKMDGVEVFRIYNQCNDGIEYNFVFSHKELR